eukprot:11154975-Lingulodinium_polyedra.AAC.1
MAEVATPEVKPLANAGAVGAAVVRRRSKATRVWTADPRGRISRLVVAVLGFTEAFIYGGP